jgi:hypothetical protein
VRLQVSFKFERFVLVGESAIPGQPLRPELGGMGGFPSIMLRQPALQIFRDPNVFLIGKFDAAEDVDAPH